MLVVADAKDADFETVVRSAGADEIVQRDPDVAERVRALHPDGVRGVLDAAVLNELALPAVADGGGLATMRGWDGPADRGILSESSRCCITPRSARRTGVLKQVVSDLRPIAESRQIEACLVERGAAAFSPAGTTPAALGAHRRGRLRPGDGSPGET